MYLFVNDFLEMDVYGVFVDFDVLMKARSIFRIFLLHASPETSNFRFGARQVYTNT